LKFRTAAVAILVSAIVALCARAQVRPASTAAQVCASASDAENLCSWDAAAGVNGRKCTLDVERLDRKHGCNYGPPTTPPLTDHKPMCFSVSNAEHIAFMSGQGRHFRVRRLIPITHKNAKGQPCPRDPFVTAFDSTKLNFGQSFDSASPKSSALGCQYKLEVQFETLDASAPAEPNDPDHRHFECRDPHLKVMN
jgi:hypothetical protein